MRWLWFLGAIFIALGVLAYVFRGPLGFMAFKMAMKPPAAFAETTPPAAPDYANPDHWAALPDRDDGADFVPAGATDGQADAGVDVFFVHPTTFIENTGWNAPMGHEAADEFIRSFVLRGQASAFNRSARVYAPHYRQAQIYAFFELENGGNDALELAYRDVEAAFEHFLAHENDGRPFIVAGHSQGAHHVRWLLERRLSGSPELGRMVGAYPVGYFFKQAELAESLPDVPVCTSPAQTGCLVTWNTTGDGYQPFEPTEGHVCVNPLSWTTGPERAEFDANKGALVTATGTIAPGATDAACRDGVLHVTDIRIEAFDDLPFDMGPGNHHLLDYALYWVNIRENVAERVAAFGVR